MIGRLNHVAIAVPSLAAAMAQYRATLGAQVSEPVAQPAHGVSVVFVALPNPKIELLEPLGAASPVAGRRARGSCASPFSPRSYRLWCLPACGRPSGTMPSTWRSGSAVAARAEAENEMSKAIGLARDASHAVLTLRTRSWRRVNAE